MLEIWSPISAVLHQQRQLYRKTELFIGMPTSALDELNNERSKDYLPWIKLSNDQE
jgi:hypothetical protein